jgi:hypothetical protein
VPTYLILVRRSQCAICSFQWDLQPLEEPEQCPQCASKDWCWGYAPQDGRIIRQRIAFLKKRINPGAKSKKRQIQGQRQGQAFKPKAEAAETPKKRKNLSRPNRARG